MSKLTFQDIERMIAAPENLHLECKEAKAALPVSFWESYSAFANTDGGIILLGVKEENSAYSIQGLDNADKTAQDIWNTINNRQKISVNLLFNRHVYAVDCDGRIVLVVEVPRAMSYNRPVFIGVNPYTGSFRRNGEGDYHCDEEAVDSMIRDKCRETADHCIVESLTVADLNQDTLRRYRNRLQFRREGSVWNEGDHEEFLVMAGAARRDEHGVVHPTRAALLMFGNFGQIVGVFPHYFVDYYEKLDDNPRYSDRICPFTVGFSGNLFDFYTMVSTQLTADVKTPFALDDEMYRIDDTPVHRAIRECLANTLIHADFAGRRGIVIEKRFRHVVFANPGTFRIPISTAISGGTSNARNDVLFNLFALVEIGEKLGTGLVQLFALWKEHQWPAPQFQEQWNPERTILTLDYNDPVDGQYSFQNSSDMFVMDKTQTMYCGEESKKSGEKIQKSGEESKKSGEESKKSGEKSKKGGEESKSGKQKTRDKILIFMKESPNITIAELSSRLGIVQSVVIKHISNLKRIGVLHRVGPDKGGPWEVIAPQEQLEKKDNNHVDK